MNSASVNILLVEDDADTRNNLCDILELDDFTVTVAESAEDARKKIVHFNDGIVILDRKLPDGDADALLPELHTLAPAMDIIVVTGFADLDGTISALKNGAADYILKPINPDALRASIQRIVQRKSIERELREEHELANRIFQTAEAVILVLDLNGKIVRFNQYLTKISGWQLQEMAGEDWFESFLPENDRELFREVFRETASGIETNGIINPLVTRDGLTRQIRWSNTTIKDDTGQTKNVLAIGLDVTDLVAAQQSAIQSDRLATIGQTMAALAHESRNALQRIQANTDLLELELQDNEQAMADIRSIQKAANDLHAHLEEVRAFAAPIQLRLETAPLAEIWSQAWDSIGTTCEHGTAKLKFSAQSKQFVAKLDVRRFEQVFRNLFENSLAASNHPLEIQIDCVKTADQHLEIAIADNGPGLDAEQRLRIFDAFYTTKDTGTGLGMAIVKRIVEAHHGDIRVDELYAHGARFLIRLPLQIKTTTSKRTLRE